jgi:hypothetical protein
MARDQNSHKKLLPGPIYFLYVELHLVYNGVNPQ